MDTESEMSLSPIKVLMLNVCRDGWHSGNMVYDMRAVQQACDTKTYGPGWPGYETTSLPEIIKRLYGDDQPDVIYSYFTPNEKVGDVYMQHYKIPENLRYFPTDFKKVKGPLKIFALSDFWARKPHQYERDLNGAGFEYCFCCFAPPYSNPKDFFRFFSPKIREQMKFVGYPRCVDKDCYKDYGLRKTHDVITVGAMWRFYPLRMHMHGFLAHHAVDHGIIYKNYPHCGTNWSHNGFYREDYAKAINQAKMLASCGGKYHLAMNKIFEAMGCKTIYVGEEPYGAQELHLEDGVNYVAVTKHNFVEKMEYYLNRPSKMDEIVDNAQKTFLTYHNIQTRAVDFVRLLEGVL